MDDFRSILTHFAGEIDQFNQSTRATLDEAGSLAETIARHRESLASSTGDLSRQQGELDQMLGARRDSLDSLVSSIKERREELEGLMQSFAEGIDGSFEKAAAGARDIGALLAETSQSTGGMIDRQFAGIRGNIEQESENMAAVVRERVRAGQRGIGRHSGANHGAVPIGGGGIARHVPRDSTRARLDPRSFAPRRGRAAAGDGTAGGHHAAGRRRSDQGARRVERGRNQIGPRLRRVATRSGEWRPRRAAGIATTRRTGSRG